MDARRVACEIMPRALCMSIQIVPTRPAKFPISNGTAGRAPSYLSLSGDGLDCLPRDTTKRRTRRRRSHTVKKEVGYDGWESAGVWSQGPCSVSPVRRVFHGWWSAFGAEQDCTTSASFQHYSASPSNAAGNLVLA